MPWKDVTVETHRQAVCYRICHGHEPVARVCREAGVSRKTVYKWLKRYRTDPLGSLSDRSRRPRSSPGKTVGEVEQKILRVRDTYGWGGRKIKRIMETAGDSAPSIRTISEVLKRCGRTVQAHENDPPPPPMRFERSRPNELWQLDHLGPREIGRRRYHGFTVVDDHSRYCFCFDPLADVTLATCWPVLWGVFGEFGLPESILCDNAFSARGLGLSHLEMWLIQLGIRPIHGRPRHPQTQGKVERLHGTIDRELFRFKARTDSMQHFLIDRNQWLRTYNLIRPHEALNDQPPISRWRASDRRRPDHLPNVEYDSNAIVRKVSQVGDIHYQRARISVARCLIGQYVRIEERPHEIGVFYAWKELRTISKPTLMTGNHNKLI